MNEEMLRGLVRLIIESEKDKDMKKASDNLLLEPSDSDSSQESASEGSAVAAGAIAGAITPLGATATYPAPDRRTPKGTRRETARAVGRAFGGASPKK